MVAELFEEDMVMDQRLRSWVTGQYDKRDAINDASYLWPSTKDKDGKKIIRVPYTLSDEIKEGKRTLSYVCQFLHVSNPCEAAVVTW